MPRRHGRYTLCPWSRLVMLTHSAHAHRPSHDRAAPVLAGEYILYSCVYAVGPHWRRKKKYWLEGTAALCLDAGLSWGERKREPVKDDSCLLLLPNDRAMPENLRGNPTACTCCKTRRENQVKHSYRHQWLKHTH
ncbi:hypothetical protein OOU_Y34scaffold00288g4 [Pyricularia oryzae Y34]|uniref:Uncharacterized protein n=1 Tax=Pyricularia oryzae (strain Y34) TaxID=1143189 RepID=A0AA97P381_PYRO3|nr:hypothetical protein OOU_Y34scaffold00288g4 [Pyricularia oryzae Y34]